MRKIMQSSESIYNSPGANERAIIDKVQYIFIIIIYTNYCIKVKTPMERLAPVFNSTTYIHFVIID